MSDNGDPTKVWAYGADGWYVAKGLWSLEYAKDLEAMGYDVERSKNMPERAGATRVVPD